VTRRRVLAASAFVLALGAGTGAGDALAQSKTGTTFGQFLLIEPGARMAGMGNTGAAFYDGLEAAYYNPAAIAAAKGKQFQFTHSSWFADIDYNYAAAALHFADVGSFWASATVLGSGDIGVRTVDQPLGTGELYSVTDFALGIGYGTEVAERFALGIQATMAQETIWNSTARTLVLNAGTLYRSSPHGLQIGASLSNFGTTAAFDGRDLRITYDQDPTRQGDNGTLPGEKFVEDYDVPVMFRVGVALPRRLNQETELRLALDAYHAADIDESVSVGSEVRFKEALSVRAGWQNLFLSDTEVGPTLGAGLRGRLDTFLYRFDYAWGDFGRLGDAHRFTLGVEF
jgi:hypothetical protein